MTLKNEKNNFLPTKLWKNNFNKKKKTVINKRTGQTGHTFPGPVMQTFISAVASDRGVKRKLFPAWYELSASLPGEAVVNLSDHFRVA